MTNAIKEDGAKNFSFSIRNNRGRRERKFLGRETSSEVKVKTVTGEGWRPGYRRQGHVEERLSTWKEYRTGLVLLGKNFSSTREGGVLLEKNKV